MRRGWRFNELMVFAVQLRQKVIYRHFQGKREINQQYCKLKGCSQLEVLVCKLMHKSLTIPPFTGMRLPW
jgi:hypothetical protein